MKELTTQEKADRFDEILEKAKRYYEEYKTRDNILYVEDMEDMFPELKESEDERIKKEILSFLREGKPYYCPNSVKRQEWASWFEKQCEQKSVSITDEWIENYWEHEKINNPYSYDKGDEIQFDHQGFVSFCKKYCQKPTDEYEWSGKIKTRKVKGVLKEMLDKKLKPT